MNKSTGFAAVVIGLAVAGARWAAPTRSGAIKLSPSEKESLRDAPGDEQTGPKLDLGKFGLDSSGAPPVAAPAAAPAASADSDEQLNALIARKLGMKSPYRVEAAGEHLGHSYNNVRKEVFDDGRQRVAVVIKGYGGGHRIGGQGRLQNELAMREDFKAAGLATPETVAAVPEMDLAVSKFLENAVIGTDIVAQAVKNDPEALQRVERVGADLALAHRSDLCVGDFKPDNVMLSNGANNFIDLDSAKKCDDKMPHLNAGVAGMLLGIDKSWDVAEFVYMAAKIDPLADNKAMLDAFLKGYLGNGGDAKTVAEAAGKRCAARGTLMFPPIAALKKSYPDVFDAARREMAAVAQAAAR